MTRIVILGGPDSGAGKLSRQLADRMGIKPMHTQSVYGLPWSEQSDAVAEWMDEPGPWVIAGPVGARALRKRISELEKLAERFPVMRGARPCDLLLWLPQSPAVPRAIRSKSGQLKALWEAVKPQCEALGVEVVELVTTRDKLDFGRKWRPEI